MRFLRVYRNHRTVNGQPVPDGDELYLAVSSILMLEGQGAWTAVCTRDMDGRPFLRWYVPVPVRAVILELQAGKA